MKLYWRPWDQGQAIANARTASVELLQARVTREEVELYLTRAAAARAGQAQPPATPTARVSLPFG